MVARLSAASAVVVRDDGRVLLVRRAKAPLLGVLTLPGGRVEDGETTSEAARREVREETGIDVVVGPHVTDVEVPPFAIAVHLAHPISNPDAARASSDASGVVWSHLDRMEKLGAPEATRRAVALALGLHARSARSDD